MNDNPPTQLTGWAMNDSQLQLSLSYHGDAVDAGKLDVYEAAANMIAFSEFVTSVGKAVYGSSVEVKAEVSGFRAGSFITDVYFQLLLPSAVLLPSVDIANVLKTLKDALDIWKHLRGAPPAAVKPTDNGDHLTITNNNGDVIVVNRPSLNIVMDPHSTKAVERFIAGALAKDGIDSLELRTGKKAVAKVTDRDAAYFTSVAMTVPVTDNEFDYALTIETAAFKDGNKWRFSDGGTSFFAEILDEEFLARVDEGEPFAKGDALRVRLRIEQSRQGQELSTTRSVIRVYEHLRKHQAGPLF